MKKLVVLMLIIVVFAGNWLQADSCSTAKKESSCSAKISDVSRNSNDIVATAISAGKFKTLVTAVKAAGLVAALQSKGPLL